MTHLHTYTHTANGSAGVEYICTEWQLFGSDLVAERWMSCIAGVEYICTEW